MTMIFVLFALIIITLLWVVLVSFNVHTKVADFIYNNKKFKNDDVKSSKKENEDNV